MNIRGHLRPAAGTLVGAIALALAGVTVTSGEAWAGGATPMPAALTFPATGTGAQSKSMTVQFVNTSMGQITIDSVTLGGAHPMDFVIVNPPNLPTGLVPNAGLTVEVAFAPTNGGMRSGQLLAQVRGEMQATSCNLTGTGIGPKITVAPSPVSMGGVLFGQPVPPTQITVSNQGGANVTVNKVSLSGGDAARFGLSGVPGLPALLTPNQSFNFNLSFTPAAAGVAMTQLVVDSTDPMTPQLTTLVTGLAGDPKVSVDLGTVIFGNQRVAQPSSPQDITITNTGLSDLKITDIKLAGTNPGDYSLGGLPKFPVSLKVQQTQKFSTTFLPTQAGARSATVQILSDDPKTPTRNVTLSGVGTTAMAMVSPAMIDFGPVKVGATGNASVSIQNSGSGPVLISALTLAGLDALSFSSSLAAPFSVAAGATTVIQVSFKPRKVASFSAALNLTTDDPNVKMASVMLKGTSTSPMFSVTPTTLDFGGVRVGKSAEPLMFAIKNSGNQAMTVNTFQLGGVRPGSYEVRPAPRTPFSVPVGMTVSYTVTYTARATGDEDATINIGVDDPNNPSATVLLTGRGQQANINTVPNDMDTMDFKKVAVGVTSKAQGIKIENRGDAPLEIKTIAVVGEDGGFSVDKPGPLTIDPSMSTTVNVSFTPLKGMMYVATLEITPADEGLVPVKLNLVGLGQSPMLTATSAIGMSSIDFGQVGVNVPSKAESVLIHNSSSLPQEVNVSTDATQFTLNATATKVPAGGTVMVDVRFTPDKVGALAGKLQLTVPGSQTPVATLALKGEGIDDGTMGGGGGDGGGGGCHVGHRGSSGGAGGALGLGLLGLCALVVRRSRGRRRP